ncbi:hypothetical protein, conserved [Babesia ovata]|uniref:protein-histidine N-methyltransferase n=1 Tax=Babesia ovata TaxID=189622 RepID=A0A2H6KE28_9APIC|nr:uncharacterized protein BOVATA_027270 [Babesia ovata]GBE61234.1 hypothetical protein, conserved [Babesia ovata]
METRVNYSLKSLVDGCRHYSVDLATCRVFTFEPKEEALSGEASVSNSASNDGSSLTIRVAAVPPEKQSATVKRRKYEGGFSIWESTWFLAAFLHEEMKTRRGGYAIDLGCGNGICGVIGLQHNYNVLFQDLNWDVLEESVIPNCILNTIGTNASASTASVKGHLQSGEKGPSPSYRKGAAAETCNENTTINQPVNNETSEASTEQGVDDLSATETKDGKAELDFGGKLDVDKAENYQFGVFRCGTRRETPLSNELPGDKTTDQHRNGLEFDLIACSWEDMANLGDSILSSRKEACEIIFASECLYRTESYPAIAAVLRTLLRPAEGVAFIATKRFYFGLDGGTFEFITFINGANEGTTPKLKASIRKSHTPQGSANVIDIIELKSDICVRVSCSPYRVDVSVPRQGRIVQLLQSSIARSVKESWISV